MSQKKIKKLRKAFRKHLKISKEIELNEEIQRIAHVTTKKVKMGVIGKKEDGSMGLVREKIVDRKSYSIENISALRKLWKAAKKLNKDINANINLSVVPEEHEEEKDNGELSTDTNNTEESV